MMIDNNGQGLLQLTVVDESSRVLSTIESLFHNEFVVSAIDPGDLEVSFAKSKCGPHFIVYVSKGAMSVTAPRIESLRSHWPKTIVLLLMPTVQDAKQISDASSIPAHQILFKPCSKKKIVDCIENYRSLVSDDSSSSQDYSLLSCLMEFAGGKRPELYVAYNRVMPLIMTLCQNLGYDWRHVQRIFIIYMIMMSHLDESLSSAMTDGGGRKAAVVATLYEQVEKMVDLLKMTPTTESMANDLKYVLKRHNGEGVPKDDVSGLELPVASKIIRLLLDYHYLLQSGKSSGKALFVLNSRTGWYDEVLVHALADMLGSEGKQYAREVYPLGLVAGMEVAEDVYGVIDGKRRKILSRNEILTEDTVDYLQRHCEDILDITEPVKIVEELFSGDGGGNA